MQESYLIKPSTHAHLCDHLLHAFAEGGNNMLVTVGTIAVAAIVKLLFFTNLMQRLNFVAIDHPGIFEFRNDIRDYHNSVGSDACPVLGFTQTRCHVAKILYNIFFEKSPLCTI